MRNRATVTAVLLAAGLALTGCSSSNSPKAIDATSTTAAPVTAVPLRPAKQAPTSSARSAAKPKPSSSDPCPPTRDVIVWMKVPDLPDSAQILGNYNQMACEPTIQWLQHTSPTGDGYCTKAAYGSDNPGYNADATPAKPLKNVQMAVGSAC